MSIVNYNRPQAIIFDWDGTLVNTLPGLHKAHNHVRTVMGREPWSFVEFEGHARQSSRELYPGLYGDRTEEALAVLSDYISAHHIGFLDVLPGSSDLLGFLSLQNLPVGLVSNKMHTYLCREVEHLGFDKYFYCMLGAGQAKQDKPAADPIIMAMELSKTPLSGESVWYIGDTETDMLAAKAAGCVPVLITHGHDKTTIIENHNPSFVVEDCLRLLKICEEIFLPENKMKAC